MSSRASSSGMLDRYKKISKIGDGAYSEVFKCKSNESGKIVAIKRFKESEEDPRIKNIALREIKMLKLLRHGNIVQLIEVFRRKKRIHLVFEFCERNSLDDIQKNPKGLPIQSVLSITYQLLQALSFCHGQNCIHRDIKPENILLTDNNIVKLCDFGFMRNIEIGNVLTDYVATRWYRAPELLVGDVHYGPKVDVWAVGCVFYEFITGNALWPGKTDLDMLYLIRKNVGDFIPRHMDIFQNNKYFQGMPIPNPGVLDPLDAKIKTDNEEMNQVIVDFLKRCLDKDPAERWTCDELLRHQIFKMVKFKKPSYFEVNNKREKSGGHLFPSLETDVRMRNSSQSLRSFNEMQKLPII